MKNILQKGILVLILAVTTFFALFSVDGNIGIVDTLILLPMVLISSFYLITPLFLNVDKINKVDNLFDSILEFDFQSKKNK
ncbi:hypothetical protein U8V72_15160 [Priestia filamentosa]|uniref:hypothetical protein n=1 Tax=Priestia filamentosa TaxID=1402861 RepID=UPI00058925C7